MSNTIIYLTYNGITKVVSNTLLKTLAHPNKVLQIQWFRYQIIKMCENLGIDIREPITNGIYNNVTLAKRILEHPLYGKIIKNTDDSNYGLKPCLKHKSIMSIPANNNQFKKHKNNITLQKPNSIVWKCGQPKDPLVEY